MMSRFGHTIVTRSNLWRSFFLFASRFLPHPWNFSPVMPLILASGREQSKTAFLLPFVLLVVSDLILGMDASLIFGYVAYGLAAALFRRSRLHWSLGILGASILFFVLSNLGVFFFSPLYSKDTAGLLLCFFSALPFFANSIMGNLFYGLLVFEGLERVLHPKTRFSPAVKS